MESKMNSDEYGKAFLDGRDDHKREIQANFDKWKRAMEAQGNTGSIFDIAQLAIRQVLYGNQTGSPPDATPPKKEA